ncbi:MAG TPA: DUF3501 family protein [Rhodospirillales bacterium]|nr:DUF3501 family protein [Rhodospirillales bacterium]
MSKHRITRADLMDMDAYIAVRPERRKAISETKKNRRVSVGPDATFYFESFDTMLHQVQEMLYIEGGGEDQIDDELSAYNPLIPNGSELVATLMFEIDDADRRTKFLAALGGVEETITITIGEATSSAIPEDDIDRTTADGKASSIQFLHFPLTPSQIGTMQKEGARVILGIDHPTYAHMAILPENIRQALCGDFG